MKYIPRIVLASLCLIGITYVLFVEIRNIRIDFFFGVNLRREMRSSEEVRGQRGSNFRAEPLHRIRKNVVPGRNGPGDSFPRQPPYVGPDVRAKEHQNVVFLKVHKAASSTVQNILFRFGLYRNLTFVLPRPPGFYWRNVISLRSSVTKANILPPPSNKTFNIICNHVIYDTEAFRAIMPNSSKYIAIVREPRSFFLSILRYSHTPMVLNKDTAGTDPIAKYFENPSLHESKNPRASYTNNRMAVDFGFPLDQFHAKNRTEILKYIRKLDREFDLVMLTEFFDESLILLKRIMKWNLKDIIYIPQNKYRGKIQKYRWSARTKENFRKWNLLDTELYKYFRKRLIVKMESEGDTFKKEVWNFKFINNKIISYCSRQQESPVSIGETEWSEAFQISRQDCLLINMHEITFVDIIRFKQYPELGFPKHLSIAVYKKVEEVLSSHWRHV